MFVFLLVISICLDDLDQPDLYDVRVKVVASNSHWVALVFVAAKQPTEEASDHGPEGAKD